LIFEDHDVGDMHFDNEAEALPAFDRYSTSWTSALFSTVERDTELRDRIEREIVELGDRIATSRASSSSAMAAIVTP
jgi:hypothetical protein